MKRLLLFLLLAAGAQAQTDAPPELDQPFAPDSMPPVGPPPKPLDGRLKLVFSGNTAFNERQLRAGLARQIQTIEQYGLDEPNAYDAAFFLDSFYRQHGYAQAGSTYTIAGPWELRLAVNEGPLARVGAITIQGNKGYDAGILTDYLLGPTRERYPRIRQDLNLPFVEADVYSGVDLIRRLYASTGYLNAEVDPPEITFNDAQTVANITLTIREGIQYRFGSIRFTGAELYPREKLLSVVQAQTRDIYTQGRLAAAARALEDYFVKHGHFAASVTPNADPAAAREGKVAAEFLIGAGPVFRFDGVTVAGTQDVKPSFIQKRLRRLNGQVYSPRAVDKSFRELIQTGLFRNVRITPAQIPGDQLRLDVAVEEAKPKEFGVGVGYASFFGAIVNANYRDLNFMRNGRPVSLDVEWNQRGLSGEATYTDPWLFDSDYQMKLRLYALNARLKGYSKNEAGFQPTFSRYLTEHWKLSAFLTAKYVAVNNIEIEPGSLVGPQEYSVFAIGFSQTLDLRNNPALPTRGYIFSTSFDIAPNGIGEVAYARALGSFSYYLPVTAKSTLALGARAGVIAPLSGRTLPIDERFFNGGATTVRSFSELTLGPKDDQGYPLGGQAYTVFNVEYTFPLYGDLYGAVFADAGNVISEAGDFGFEDMRYAVGAGLRYNLPIGAIRFDYGLNPSPRKGEAQGAFHFAIGVAF